MYSLPRGKNRSPACTICVLAHAVSFCPGQNPILGPGLKGNWILRGLDREGVTSGMFTGGFLGQAIELMGVDRIMFSADDPFIPVEPGGARKFIAEAPLSAADKAKIAHGNWERLIARA